MTETLSLAPVKPGICLDYISNDVHSQKRIISHTFLYFAVGAVSFLIVFVNQRMLFLGEREIEIILNQYKKLLSGCEIPSFSRIGVVDVLQNCI